MRIGLVGCVKKKRQVTLPARDLYISTLFRGRRKYVERSCDRWFILSAKHGLLDPGVNVAPYGLRIDDLTVAERREWSQRVLVDLKNSFGELRGDTFEVHAGQKYLDSGLVAGLRARGAQVENPVSGLAFGKQLRFYRLAHPPVPGTVASADTPHGISRVYAGLHAALLQHHADMITLSFHEMEVFIGRPLPPSARKSRPWWGNDASHVQARAWLGAYWQVDAVDFSGEHIRFRRCSDGTGL